MSKEPKQSRLGFWTLFAITVLTIFWEIKHDSDSPYDLIGLAIMWLLYVIFLEIAVFMHAVGVFMEVETEVNRSKDHEHTIKETAL